MILSKIEFDRSIPYVRAAMADCQRMHTLIMALFDTSREESNVLFRPVTQGKKLLIYMYSEVMPNEKKLLPGMQLMGAKDISAWTDDMTAGRSLNYSIVTMPSKKVSGDGKNSRRRVLRTHEERLKWFAKKAEQNGFALCSVEEIPSVRISGSHSEKEGGRMYMDAYEYRGRLCITEPTLFKKALKTGIGPGKAYGLGMLLLV